MALSREAWIGLLFGGGAIWLLSRGASAKTVTGNGTPTNKAPTPPPVQRTVPPVVSASAPIPQIPSDIATVTNDAATLRRVTDRMAMELDALAVPPDDNTVQRAVRHLRGIGTDVPGNLDLISPGPIVIWAARKVDAEILRRFYS